MSAKSHLNALAAFYWRNALDYIQKRIQYFLLGKETSHGYPTDLTVCTFDIPDFEDATTKPHVYPFFF